MSLNSDPVKIANELNVLAAQLEAKMGPSNFYNVPMTYPQMRALANVVLAAAEWKAAHDDAYTVDARVDPEGFAHKSNRCDAADDALAAALKARP